MRTRVSVRALVLVALVVSSVFAPMLALGTGAASASTSSAAPPAGMVGVDASNINDIRPSSMTTEVSVSDLTGAVYTSKHAETTEVDIVTGTQAAEVARGASPADIAGEKVCANPAASKNPAFECDTGARMALVISDDVHHDGRTVAVRVDVVKEALGFVPETIAVANNETGESWQSPAEVRDGWLVADVEHFSSNSVSFTGTISINANPAQDGDTFTYEINDLDSASNFTIDVTGSNATEWDNVTGTHYNGDSYTVSAAGTDIRGPSANGEPVVVIEGSGPVQQWSTQPHSDKVVGVAESGSYVFPASNDGTVKAIYKTNGTVAWTHSNYNGAVNDVATDGTYVYAADDADETIRKLAISDGSQKLNISLPAGLRPLEVATNGTHVVAGTYGGDPEVITYDASTGSEVWNNSDHTAYVAGLAMDGSIVYTGSNDNTVKKIDGTGTTVWTFSGHTNRVDGVATNGTHVFTGSLDHSVRAVDASTGGEVWSFTGHTSRVNDLAVDGPDLLSASDDNTVRLLNPDTGTERWSYTGHTDSVKEVAPDATEFYSGDGSFNVHGVTYVTKDPSVSVDGTTVVSHTGRLRQGETATGEVALSVGDHSVDVTTTGAVDVTVQLEEVTETTDPAVEVNGQTTSYTGTLADGETTSLPTNESWILNGTNTVNVSASTGVSADAPTPRVNLAYSHEATSTHSINYTAEELTVRYEVGKNFTSDQTGVEMNISFDKKVYEMRDIEKQTNGGGWSSVASSNYRITANNDLVVDIGSVTSGDHVEIRANGSRMETQNMTVTVVEPTTAGDELDSKIRIDSKGEDARMVLAKGSSAKLYYPTLESWSSPKGYVVIEATGRQTLYLPNAAAGETFRLKQHETEVIPQSNEVEVRVTDSGIEPKLRIRPGATDGDEVKFIYYSTTSGETYVLNSVTHETARDQAEAQSPVTLIDDDSLETLEIYEESDGTTSTDPTGEPIEGIVGGAKEAAGDIPPILILLGALGITVGLYYLDRRTPGERFILLGIGAVPTWLVALELVGVPVISLPLVAITGGGSGGVVPAIALSVTGITIYIIYSWWQARKTEASTPEKVTNVSFNLKDRGGN